MNETIYEKNGIRIEKYICYEEDIQLEERCYQLELASEPLIAEGSAQRTYTTEEMKELVADLVELRIGKEKSSDKIKLIRRRESYKCFVTMAKRLKEIELTSKQIEELLDIYYESMDSAHAYGSERSADFAYESLQQVKEDLKGGALK